MSEEKNYMKNLIEEIKRKREISGVSEILINELINEYLRKNNIYLDNLKKRERKIIIKEIRAELRKYTGRFQGNNKQRDEFLEKDKINDLLKTHKSTRERIEIYDDVKKIIYGLDPSSILDLGCGLNPIAVAKRGIKYYASDIKEDELKIMKKFFEKNKIEGETFFYDIRKGGLDLPEVDLCLLLKLLDIIEEKGHKIAENLLKNIKCKYFIVSFPTKKISGKPMKKPERIWFEKILNRLGYYFKIEKRENEVFYIIKN